MKAELETEMEDDKEVYEKLVCWCETGTKEKTKAIEEGEANIASLEASIEEYTAKLAELKELLGNTKDEKNKNWDALNKASAMRMKENGEFHSTEKELMLAIASAKQALVVLSEQHPEFAQIRRVVKTLESLPDKWVAESSLSGSQVVTFKGFLQKAPTADSFLAIPGMQSYAPQSGQIVGIIKQLKEEFEKDLKELQDGESKAVDEFTTMKGAKEGEMAAGKKQIEKADADFAEFSEKKAQAEEELADTEEQVATDKTFLANLKKKCDAADKEFAERSKARLEEIKGVTDTIAFLDSDEAHAMFDKTVNTAFVQESKRKETSISFEKVQEKMKRRKAVDSLMALAQRTQSPRIALLVTSARLDAFTEVIAEIDKMLAELKKQQADEVTERDWCIAELNKNNRTLEAKYDEQANLLAKEEDLTSTIDQLTKAIATKKQEIADMQTEMKRGSEDREAANAEYQTTVADQRVTQMILTKALDRMKEVYALMQKKAAPHIQTSATDTDPGNGPARFGKYEQNAGGKKVIAMIEEVIAGEQDSQQAYENFMKDSNKSIEEYTKAISNMSADLAKAKEELVRTKEDLAANSVELEDLHATEASLHKSCDYLLKNFEVRQAARLDEIDGLNEAKAILSGAK